MFPPTTAAIQKRKERDGMISTIYVTTGGSVEDRESGIVGPGYQPGCIILRVGNLAD
jgi:hypothetical protein